VLEIGKNHIVIREGGTAMQVDKRKRSDFFPSKSDRNRFYFGNDGLIYAYGDDDTNLYGIPAKTGPQSPKDVAVSIAQYNTVMSATLAFMSARGNFLRNGPVMKALLKDFNVNQFDPGVRDAMKYSRDVGKMLPPLMATEGVPGRMVKMKRFDIDKINTGDGAGAAALGVMAVGGLLAYLKWGRG
jgi:hypothetical protein